MFEYDEHTQNRTIYGGDKIDDKINQNSCIANRLINGNGKIFYDENCKLFLSNKKVLSLIIKDFMYEFKNKTVDEILNTSFNYEAIEGIPNECLPDYFGNNFIGSTVIYDILLNIHCMFDTEDTNQQATEDTSQQTAEGTNQQTNSEQKSKDFLLNIEAQAKYYTNYNLYDRAHYYISRLSSNQKKSEESDSYSGIKKVYSIWIIFNPPKYLKDSCFGIHDESYKIVGDDEAKFNIESKHEIIFIFLDRKKISTKLTSMRILSAYFSDKEVKEKLIDLEEFFPNISKIQTEEEKKMFSFYDATIGEDARNFLANAKYFKQLQTQNEEKQAEIDRLKIENAQNEKKNQAEIDRLQAIIAQMQAQAKKAEDSNTKD